jgi:predicted nucleic acid-binding protein
MKSLVIDGSMTLCFLLPDEYFPPAFRIFQEVENGTPTYVPTHWWIETANGLLMAERRKRATQAAINHALRLVQKMPILIDDETAQRCGNDIISLARQYTLTMYDAAYLELALRRNSALATLDKALAKAAAAAGVTILA